MPAPRGGRALNRFFFWLAAILTLLADLLSKAAVMGWLASQEVEQINVAGSLLTFTRHLNTGGMWSILRGQTAILLAVTAILLPAIVFLAYSCRPPSAPLWALGLVLGGAAGNFYDRIRHQGVRDFIQVDLGFWPANPWPVFNVADIGIVAGVLIFLGWQLCFAPAEGPPAPNAAAERSHAQNG
ncbi:MAG: signal peptidase II [Planctomycetota bacterium]|nr:signal peptidase II [Planctomycetota bacterium]